MWIRRCRRGRGSRCGCGGRARGAGRARHRARGCRRRCWLRRFPPQLPGRGFTGVVQGAQQRVRYWRCDATRPTHRPGGLHSHRLAPIGRHRLPHPRALTHRSCDRTRTRLAAGNREPKADADHTTVLDALLMQLPDSHRHPHPCGQRGRGESIPDPHTRPAHPRHPNLLLHRTPVTGPASARSGPCLIRSGTPRLVQDGTCARAPMLPS